MITIVEGDITILAVDAIVNAANESLLGGGGVDGAIHRAAGRGLLQACREIGRCPTGQACITPGFDLPSSWVIHTAGPRWRGGRELEPEMLESCYVNCLELAARNGVRTIAFPGISTGVYGYPKRAATGIAISVMRRYEYGFDEIICCCFSAQDKMIYQQIAGQA